MKGTVSVISSHPPCKDVNSRFTIFYCKISENLHMDIFTGTKILRFKWNTVRTRKLWNWKTTFRFKLSNEHKTNKLCCVNILISLNTWLDLSHCINIWCETTSNIIDHIINVVFLLYSFLVLTVSIEVF